MRTTEGVRRALRQSIQRARQTLPFQIDAWVLLPDHLHAVWTLPSEDDNYAARWAIIKRQVSTLCGKQFSEIENSANPSKSERKAEFDRGDIGNIKIGMTWIISAIWIICIGIR
jgi:REP element-mobilizing transposase RayT